MPFSIAQSHMAQESVSNPYQQMGQLEFAITFPTKECRITRNHIMQQHPPEMLNFSHDIQVPQPLP